MANWTDLKAAVAQVVKTNGNKEITGQVLQTVLNSIISNLGENATFKGIAEPTTVPGTPDGVVFYLASKKGIYANFGGAILTEGETAQFVWKDSWIKTPLNFSTKEVVDKMTKKNPKGGNLLDQTNLYPGWIDSNGNINANADYGHTELIPIAEGETLKCNIEAGTNPRIALYDVNGNFISGVQSTVKQITGTANSKYVRWTIEYGKLTPSSAIYSGEIPTVVIPFNPIHKYFADEMSIERIQIDKKLENKVSANPTGGNLLNPIKFVNGWIDSAGNINVSTDYGYTELIPIANGQTFVANFDAGGNPQIALYDLNGNFLSSVPTTAMQITGTAISKFVRWTVNYALLTPNSGIFENAVPIKNEPYNPISGYINGLKVFETENNLLIGSKFNISEHLTLVPTTFVDGIFEDGSQNSYHTSNYIEILAKENINYYISFGNTMNSGFDLIRFYDANHIKINNISGNSPERPKTEDLPYLLKFPYGTKFVKYSTLKSKPNTGLFSAPAKTLDQCINDSINGIKGKILWLGTSIPQGAEYPVASCSNLSYECINNARGSSGVRFDPVAPAPQDIFYASGFGLSATVAEKETKWRPFVTNGTITEAQLNLWKTYSYENLLLPYLDQVDAIVFDHAYNDRYELDDVFAAGKNAILWDKDRKTFIGAMTYLFDEIWKRKPFMKIIICSYFQNTINDYGYNGEYVCTVQKWLAEHFQMPFMDVYNYSQMGRIFIPDSSNYISNFNTTYGTNYTKFLSDGNGNITQFQLFNPDAVHPHSDLTGNSNKRLNAIVTKLLRDTLI